MLIVGIQVALFLLATAAYALYDWLSTGELKTTFNASDVGAPSILGWIWLFAPYILYHTLLLRYWNGHTPGKNFMMVQVLSKDALTPRLWQALLRTLLMPVSALPFLLGYLAFSRSHRNTSLHDLISRTVVLQEEVEHRVIRGTVPPQPVSSHH